MAEAQRGQAGFEGGMKGQAIERNLAQMLWSYDLWRVDAVRGLHLLFSWIEIGLIKAAATSF
jgi:hypothetical protein